MGSTEYIELNGLPILGVCYHDIPPRYENHPQKLYHTLRITFVEQGSGIWTIGNRNFKFSSGDIFIFNNNEYRSISTIYPPQNLLLTVIDFEPRFIWSNQQDLFNSSYLKIFFERKNNLFENCIRHVNPVSLDLHKLMLEIQDELACKFPEYKQMIKVKLLNILVILNRYYSNILDIRNEPPVPQQHFALVIKALEYIEDHLYENLSRDDIAIMLNINPSGLSKFFKKYNGIGLTQYIIKKRIHKSVELLESSNLSILEIANSCGFNSSANFYKAFKSVTGNIPSHYRKTQ
ncbi:helix-turn-helix domain-containing protein [Clostridium lacusfryxellense]|uniref:helix-turn-helix domain-containing protein n=1 Tax=Clostridium lacusfryxellense TaxID=205328 RepID=UPI001C0CDB9A|nr:AraC family transcriptional regulator [Clostridium lacusfryxellense]MBU3113307.1 AraC family transcriptional regulator [Clostridium lacusfryxellense]